MNKKAVSYTYNVTMMVVKIILLIFALFPIVVLVRSHFVINIDILEGEAKILTNRIMYTENSLAYVNPDTMMVEPGVINYINFKNTKNIESIENKLLSSINFGNLYNKAGAKISVYNMSDSLKGELYFDKDAYNYWVKYSKSGFFSGPGSVYEYSETHHVFMVDENQNLEPVVVTVHMLLART